MKLVLAALMLSTLLLPAPVLAAPKQDDVAQARAHFKKGTELYRQARYREAIAEFEAAYKAKPHGVLHYNIAQCHEKLGDIPAALKSYHEYLRESPNAEDKAEVLAAMSNLEKRLSATGVQQLLVYSDPPEAEVWVDGHAKGRTPFSVVLPHGTHSVSLVKPGYRTLTRETVLAPDRSVELDLTLQKGPSSTPVAVPLPPPPAMPALAGSGAVPESKPDLTPTPPSPLAQPGPPAVAPKKSRVWTWVALGAAAAVAGVGTYYGLSAQSASNQLADGTVRTQSQVQSLHDDAQSKARTANILYAVAGATGAAGITLFFVEGSF
jgi:tetratricopeptide (TPR) repeat protein